MKSVYIDVLITVNVFIDFILILCTKKALCINTSFKKMLLASLLGGVQSLIALFEYTYRCFMCRRNCVMCIRQVSV